MELLLTDEQRMLQESVARHLAQAGGVKRTRGLRGKTGGFDRAAHAHMADEGWFGLMVPVEHGGLGLGLTELALVLMEAGRVLAPEPIGATAAMAYALAINAQPEVTAELLPGILSGRQLVLPAVTGDERLVLAREAEATVSGTLRDVAMADVADGFLVPVGGTGRQVLAYVGRDAKGLRIVSRATVDGRALADLTFDDVVVGHTLDDASTAARDLYDLMLFAAAAELVGVMSAALDMTVEYLKVRQQFGKPIGSFQALQHRAVDDLARIVSARSFLFQVAAQGGVPSTAMASALKAHTSEEALKVTKSAIQMHGGMGFTDEHDIGLYLKRAMWLSAHLGNAAYHRRRYAAAAA